jgi:hypothetical protein
LLLAARSTARTIVADLLATVANQEMMRIGGPDWADPQSRS